MESIFEIRDAEEGGFCARALSHAIFTGAGTSDELRSNVPKAVDLHFDDEPSRPHPVQLHLADAQQQFHILGEMV